ncbi:MAG: hypothetical protein WBE76_05820 [Terracidiphilus sp.]
MKREVILSLSIAVACLVFAGTGFAQTQNADQTAADTTAQQQATMMVRAQVAMVTGLDARKDKPGEEFRARLNGTVHLKNGPELPHGTVLIGQVTTDDMQTGGNSRLALRFTEAKLKDGKVIPLKAMIVGLQPPDGDKPADQSELPWNAKTLQVDQVGVFSGVDLHSNIASQNSGVFVTSTKDNVKLRAGSELTLAIAAQGSGQQNAVSGAE